jgi:DNA-binding NtrC family response regulator
MTHGAALVVDHDFDALQSEQALLIGAGIETISAASALQALDLVRRHDFDVVMLNLATPDRTGLAAVRELCRARPDIPIIVYRSTADAKQSPLEAAVEDEVFDCLHFPADVRRLLRTVQHAIAQGRLLRENRRLSEQVQQGNRVQTNETASAPGPQAASEPVLIGESEAIRNVRRQLAEVATTPMAVLLTGESGTGKDVCARLIHKLSDRNDTGAFVKINCPAIPEPILEAELFGSEPGAVAGGEKMKPGRMEMAGCGTLFLNEISGIPLMVQAKLLQVLENQHFTRPGDGAIVNVNARILAASNAPLDQMIEAGTFRTDLFFRMNQYPIRIPPLRERVEDIPLLVEHFLRTFAPSYGHHRLSVSDDTLSNLIEHAWPGNVLELESAMRRYALTGNEQSLSLVREGVQGRAVETAAKADYRDNEKKLIMAALMRARWNRRLAAEMLGMSYNTLRRRISKYHLDNQTMEMSYSSS